MSEFHGATRCPTCTLRRLTTPSSGACTSVRSRSSIACSTRAGQSAHQSRASVAPRISASLAASVLCAALRLASA